MVDIDKIAKICYTKTESRETLKRRLINLAKQAAGLKGAVEEIIREIESE